MRIFCLANNWVGWQVLSWLGLQGANIVGLAVHPYDRRKYTNEILATVNLPAERVFNGTQLRQPEILERIADLRADIALSLFFGYILKPDFLQMFPAGVVNLHPAYLPYNRGAHPNVWSIIEGTPAGATLHYLDDGVDTGDIISRRQVEIEPIDTGEILYRKLETCCVELFKESWSSIRSGVAPRVAQQSHEGTSHRVKDVEKVDTIDLDRSYTGRELINLLRARTFSPYSGAYFYAGQQKIGVRLELFYEEGSESRRTVNQH